MRVTDSVTAQRFGVDEAYQRFFDGFYNLGKPAEVFERTIVMSPPRLEPAPTRRSSARGLVKARRGAKRPKSHQTSPLRP